MSDGWRTEKLGDLCEIELGKTPARANKTFWDEERETTNVWLSIADLLSAEDKFVVDSKEYLSDNGAAISKTVRKGTLLVSFKLTLGRLAFAGRDLFTNEAIAALTIRDERELSKEFLFYFLHFFDWRKAAENDVKLKGMTLNKAKLKQIAVHFPSPAEQQRIVSILDEVFAGIATAKASAEKNFQNARALFESHLQYVFTQRGEGWQNKSLAETCEVFADGDWVESKDQSSEGIRLIQTGNVGKGVFKNRGDKARYISAATFKRLRCTEIFAGDCLISRLPDPVGRSCLLPDTGERMITAVDCTIVRFNANQVMPAFFIYYSQSQDYLRAVEAETTGTTRNRISRSNLGQVAIPVAPRTDQKLIIAKLDLLSAETQRLGFIYQRKLAALDELKKSLLHQAFTGQLGAHAA